MTPIRPNGLLTVAMAIVLLAIEAVTVLGVARAVAWWDGPQSSALVRAGATAWDALARSAAHSTVRTTLPVALAALRTTRQMEQAVAAIVPGVRHGRLRPGSLPAVQTRSLITAAPGVSPSPDAGWVSRCKRDCRRRAVVHVVTLRTVAVAQRTRPTT